MVETRPQILSPDTYVKMPWKNGGGVTREVFKAEANGTLLWRLSIADVEQDGPFSAFPGMNRILTVIEGAGLLLSSPARELPALPLQPVAFSGEEAIHARLITGPIRDFNLIFSATRLEARATVLAAGAHEVSTRGRDGAVLFLTVGRINGAAVEPLSVALLAHGTASLTLEGPAIHIDLHLLQA